MNATHSNKANGMFDSIKNVLTLVFIAAALAIGYVNTARAQTGTQAAWAEVSADLQSMINASTTPELDWAKDFAGVRHVKGIALSTSSDPQMVSLRTQVLAAGGSGLMLGEGSGLSESGQTGVGNVDDSSLLGEP